MARKIIFLIICSFLFITCTFSHELHIKISYISCSQDRPIRILHIFKSTYPFFMHTNFNEYCGVSQSMLNRLSERIEKSHIVVQIKDKIEYGSEETFLIEIDRLGKKSIFYTINKNRGVLLFLELLNSIDNNRSNEKIYQRIEYRLLSIIDENEYHNIYEKGFLNFFKRRRFSITNN